MLIGQLFLAAVSFLFHRLMKYIMQAGLLLRDAVHAVAGPSKNQQWIVLSNEDMLARPGALPLIMTTAPRWNTHAILATLSPLVVRHTLEIDTLAADRSAGSWTIVICTYAGRRTLTSIGSHSSHSTGGRAQIHLKPGKYWLGLRYYAWRSEVQLPAVGTDGKSVTAGRKISPETNSFYRDLHTRSNLFYLALHYYVFVLLSYPGLFSERFIRRELLPMGNPETEFLWGVLRKGESLQVQLSPESLPGWNVLLTVYSQASFPIHSEHVRDSEVRFLAPASCIYLFRVNRKNPGEKVFPRDWLRLQTLPCQRRRDVPGRQV